MTIGFGVIEDGVVWLRQTRENWMRFDFVEAKKIVYYCWDK